MPDDITYSVTLNDTTGNVSIDTTLKISGAAADAKTVGDRLDECADSQDIYEESQAREAADDALQTLIKTMTGETDAAEGKITNAGTIYSAITSAISAAKTSFLGAVFPVGAIYVQAGSVSTNPGDATVLGFGTWEKIAGKFLLGSSDDYALGSTGGASSFTHSHGSGKTGSTTLTTSQIPAHTHGKKKIYGYFTLGIGVAIYNSNTTNLFGAAGTYTSSNASTSDKSAGNYSDTDITSVCTLGNVSGKKYKVATSTGSETTAHTGKNMVVINASHEHASVGGGKGHTHTIADATQTILPPYEAVNIWRRTA